MNAFDINRIFEFMLSYKENISDLNFSVGRSPQIEVDGKLISVPIKGLEKINAFQTELMALAMIGGDREITRKLVQTGSTDLSYSIPGLTRFRVNIFMQRGTYSIVMRVIPSGVPTIDDLNLPKALYQVAQEKFGIVLVTGPTGSGKSTTLATIINEINMNNAYHIVTIEDPIEYLHPHRLSTINQRELGTDTTTFSMALRAALRQAPKVVLVGEMRDLETTEIALEAAETGHLVLSTLHTTDASKTIDRIIGIFPEHEEQQIRTRFSQSFKWVISQRLIPKKGGGRIAVFEILKSTMRTREYIQKGESEGRSLSEAMADGYLDGMQIFDNELEKMVRTGTLDEETALSYSNNPNNLKLALQGLSLEQGGGIIEKSEDFEEKESPRPPAQKAGTAAAKSGSPGADQKVAKPSRFEPQTNKPDWME